MRDAFGGIVNIVIIVVFLTLVSGYLAFNVNYTKAYRVKNKIVSTLEEENGNCGSSCENTINAYMVSLGYSTNNPGLTGKCGGVDPNQKWSCKNGYCLCKVVVSKKTEATSSSPSTPERFYYKVVTQINIDIPIINKILPEIDGTHIEGNTKQFQTWG